MNYGLILNTGQRWDVNVPHHIFAKPGSNVIIPCVLPPPTFYTDDVQVYWKIREKSPLVINELDKNAFVYHTNENLVLERYRGKASVIGNKDKGNCTLVIRDLNHNETSLCLRVVAKGQPYSFFGKPVSITLPHKNSSKSIKIYQG